ncbi:sensor histidine kinase [Spirosoma sp. KCTC 42546]|uniref:sensor histidine kinase n=1 Tax=Spirosoma sp. KCTC 42546 TaxID=2520506 RepID=UPI00143D4EF4|nr:sensor histidine kinase [Spirosoma sp. KCTC 42546]
MARLLFGGAILACGMIWAYSVNAQTPQVGKLLYEKLAKTQQEYKEAMATGDSLAVAETCYLMGKRYGALGDYLTAQKWFIRSLRIREPLGPSEDIGKVYLRMTENEVIQKHYQAAMQYAHRAEANMRVAHSIQGQLSANNVLAGVYELGWKMNHERPGAILMAPANSLDSSLYYLRRAEKMAIALNKPYEVALIYNCMGKTLALKDARHSIQYLKKAYAIYGPMKQPYPLINISQELADCYLKLGQPGVAKKWLDTATHMRDSTGHGDYWQNRNIEEVYTKLYKQTGQWRLAFDHQEKYLSLLVQTMNADREGAIARSAMLYEIEKKEGKLKAQQKELALRQESLKAQQRLIIITTVLFLMAGVACVFFYWLFRKYLRISGHNAKLVREQNHRVKNNLQSITSLLGLQFNRLTDSAARQAVEESLLRVEAMALVHQRLYDGDRLVEVDLTHYIPELVGGVLRSFSFDHIRQEYDLRPIWLNADAAVNVGLLLNELVTNSCKYAFPFHPKPVLEIGCQEENGRIRIWFSDNGPGFMPSAKGNSFGMKLIDMITEKLKGKKSFSANKGSQFTLSFDCQALTMSS